MPDEVITTPFGKFLINPKDCVGTTLKAGTLWDGPGFLQVIAREYGRLGEVGTTILDIGAHLGDWTVWLAGQGAWRVVAVEPAPVMLQYLKANLDLNKQICADRVVILPVAAYHYATALQWTAPYQETGGAALAQKGAEGAEWVQASSLDDYQYLFGQRVSLIKIDAQGCDFPALRGLEQTILRHRPTLVFEWEPELAGVHGQSLVACLGWLTQRGYDTWEWPSQPGNYLARPR